MGGCTHDDLDAEAPFGIQYSAHMAEIEYTELRLQGSRSGFGNTHGCDTDGLHHGHVLVHPLINHIFIVVGASEDEPVRKAPVTFGKLGGPWSEQRGLT